MDFYQVDIEYEKKSVTLKPIFNVKKSKDLMIRGKTFYGVWDETAQIWSTDEYDMVRIIDNDLFNKAEELKETSFMPVKVKSMSDHSSKMWTNYKTFLRESPDNYHVLDDKLTFANTEVKKSDYVSRKLPYPLEEGSIDAYDELIGTLFTEEERRKLEWAIGSIIAGDSKSIQKFIVLYGPPGSGKSTFLNIVQKLFAGYYTMFEAKALVGSNNSFATETFRSNPLVAIQHDGDLSKIEDNTKLNSIISHEEMEVSEKYKSSYVMRYNAFLFMGTNEPVKIRNSKSGLLRRLIDVHPSGNKVSNKRYHTLMSHIDFELGAIAWHCLQVYQSLGKNYYSSYVPLDMMFNTDMFFNFMEENYYILKDQDGISLKQAWEMYKTYCEEASLEFKLSLPKFREELKNYFEKFQDMARIDGKQVRSYYSGFLIDKFSQKLSKESEESPVSLVLDGNISLLDEKYANCPAQYATETGIPERQWVEVATTLGDLDTARLHYVQLPKEHIVIDFDLKNEKGEKSLELNLEAASKWPTTYSEISKSGQGIHLHYIFSGDTTRLMNEYSPGIEIKTFKGGSALRRKLTKCCNSSIATLNSGLPLKGEKMINFDAVKSERGLRDLIMRNLKKEFHPGTKPSIDFIFKILEDAHKSGMKYDVTDMRQKILTFATNSTNQADYCIKRVNKMQFCSEEPSDAPEAYQSDELIFFDVEVFPNLFIVCWKAENKDPVKMINPTSKDIEELLKFKLVGYNNRRYDNHILYARYIGYDNEQLFNLSQKIVSGSKNCMFGEAYNLSYTDVYDFSSKKQSLKKFQIELGIHHKELGLPWDKPVPEELWDTVAEYCINDIVSLQKVFEERKQDFIARLILSDLSGLTPNDTTQQHTAKIIFGNDKKPQEKFIYTDLSKTFPGYIYENGKSTYRGEETGEGGYVYAEPGMYKNVAVLDIASMHPTSLVELNMFGPYTKMFKELLDARLAIKHGEYEKAKGMLGGILVNYLTNEGDSGALSYALKIVINIVYGLTSAKFENKFKDPRNKDNIVAKRGALFMIDLKHAVQEFGGNIIHANDISHSETKINANTFVVSHIKTDSIKIPDATPEIIDFIVDFGKKYGYTFEHETTYEKFCLINDAVYIATTGGDPIYKNDKYIGPWTATGAQFAEPYVFKTLFSKEQIRFEDLIQAKSVTTALYLDMNENLPEGEHNYRFIGKVGAFCPIKPGFGGGVLLREKDGKYYAATGSKGYRWLEAEVIKETDKEQNIDLQYYQNLVEASKEDIAKFGDVEWFLGNKELPPPPEELIGIDDAPPWAMPCGSVLYNRCDECPKFDKDKSFEPNYKCELGYDTLPF